MHNWVAWGKVRRSFKAKTLSATTGPLQAVQRSGQSQAPLPPRLPRPPGGGGCRGAGQEAGLTGRPPLPADGGGAAATLGVAWQNTSTAWWQTVSPLMYRWCWWAPVRANSKKCTDTVRANTPVAHPASWFYLCVQFSFPRLVTFYSQASDFSLILVPITLFHVPQVLCR